jgi:hypothetical protein
MDLLKFLTVLWKQAFILLFLGIIIHKVMKNLKFSSKHEGIVNIYDQVITCDKHSTEVL